MARACSCHSTWEALTASARLNQDDRAGRGLGRKAPAEQAVRAIPGLRACSPPGAEHSSVLRGGTEPSSSARPAPVQSLMPQALPSPGFSMSGRPSGRKGRSCREEVRDVLTSSCTSKGDAEPWGELLMVQTWCPSRSNSGAAFVSVE